MAGGQATNSGINYQQRIAAWCLVNQYISFDMSIFFDHIDEKIEVEKVLFETDKPIDDLNLLCEDRRTVFLQIKRSLSLSVSEDSDFYKSIKQFAVQFLKNRNTRDYFGLVTSSDSSSKITSELKKIVGAIRLNLDALEDNPLNDSEKDTLAKVSEVFEKIHLEHLKRKSDPETLNVFFARVFISVIDIEAGQTFEIATMMLLRGIGFRSPELIWSVLIKNSLTYASKRLSIDRKKLQGIFDRHLAKQKQPEARDRSDDLKTEIHVMGDFSTVKEVLLIESFDNPEDFMLVELFRFTQDCTKKGRFSNGNYILGNGEKWKVLQRFAAFAGFERFMEDNKELLRDGKLFIAPAGKSDGVEDSDCANLHKKYIQSLIDDNQDIQLCLHCGKSVAEKMGLIIEIDDDDSVSAFGLAHKDCIRPIDRIMGTLNIPNQDANPYLETFDFSLWVSLLLKGQGLMNQIKYNPGFLNGREAVIGWNSSEEYDSDYSYCIKFNLEDGSTSYAYQRGRIERLNKIEAEKWRLMIDATHKRSKQEGDPFCSLSISKDSGTYSQLLTSKQPEEKILEIVSVEVAKYSKAIAKLFDRDLFYYAPICMLRDKETEQIFNMGNVVPLVSDPLRIEDYLENWKKLDFDVDNLELKIIKTDKDFDNYMRIILGDGFTPLIDPLFNQKSELLAGFAIYDQKELIRASEKRREENGG